jgi:hypothetical protein
VERGAAAAEPASPPENKARGAKADAKPGAENQNQNHALDHDTKRDEKEHVAKVFSPGQEGAMRDFLRQAYVAMSKADHDYDGHRLHAMRDTSEAAKILGETLAGDGHDREAQMTSDEELREAAGLLVRARALAAAHGRLHVVEHIDAARQQISIALNIR